MVVTPMDKFLKFYKRDNNFLTRLKSIESVIERRKMIALEFERFLINYNITKSTISEYEIYSGQKYTLIYLFYQFQKECGVDLGICPYFKMWYNRLGDQQRCEKHHVKVKCLGKLENCEKL